jgi:hypothetical protein
MRRKAGNEQGTPELVAGALVAVWGWRIELVLVAVPVLAWWLLARSLGELAAAAIVAWALAGLLVSPWRRAALARLLRACRARRRFRRARVDAGLAPVRLGRVRQVPAGEVARVRVSSGWSVEELEDSPQLPAEEAIAIARRTHVNPPGTHEPVPRSGEETENGSGSRRPELDSNQRPTP